MVLIYYFVWVFTRIVTKLFFRIRINGMENLPRKGGFILATNHISYYDPPLVGSWCSRPLHYLAKKELFKPMIGWVLRGVGALPVRRGTVDRAALDKCDAVINEGRGLLIFPEGTRSKRDSFLPPKPGLGMIALRAGCPIIPGYIHGSNRLRDCLLGRARMSITYGPPLVASELLAFESNKVGYLALAQLVMDRIQDLKDS